MYTKTQNYNYIYMCIIHQHTYVHSYKYLSFNNQFRKESQQCQGRSEASVEVMGEAGGRVGRFCSVKHDMVIIWLMMVNDG